MPLSRQWELENHLHSTLKVAGTLNPRVQSRPRAHLT